MLVDSLKTKRCILVCGGGGVGKTTISASIALAATHYRKRVLVVTIDPAKRLAEAFGYKMDDLASFGAPLELSPENLKRLEVPEGASLSVGILNPKYVLNDILLQVLKPEQRDRLTQTQLYSQLSEMIYGLQEYTAYEWVTRMLAAHDGKGEYDLIVLDTPPALHAKDFFNAPERITRLMESKVFQLFSPKKTWFSFVSSKIMSFAWIENLLGSKVFHESRVFFETFVAMRDKILLRCAMLSQFFEQQEVEVVAVATSESSALHELEGLSHFLKQKHILLETVILNQMELESEFDEMLLADLKPELKEKLAESWRRRQLKTDQGLGVLSQLKSQKHFSEIISVPVVYVEDGLEILRQSAKNIIK